MSTQYDPLDTAISAKIDMLIVALRRQQKKRGKFTNSQMMSYVARIYGIPDTPDHPAGPVVCMAAELLLRLINNPEV